MTRLGHGLIAILSLACALHAGTLRAADPSREFDAKTAFLYNFALFTEWPEQAPPGLVYCVLGEDRFGRALDALQSGRLRGVPVEVRRLSDTNAVAMCHVVFLGSWDVGALRRSVAATRGLPVLTVSDAPRAMDAGVMIAMAYESNRVVFEVNLEPVKLAGLTMSSKLLRLARTVY